MKTSPYESEFLTQTYLISVKAFDLIEMNAEKCGRCKARPDCTYVLSDLALHPLQDKWRVKNRRMSAKMYFRSQ